MEVVREVDEAKAGVNLGIIINTVAVHRASIMKKMGVHKTADLVVRAIRCSLVSVSPVEHTELDAEHESANENALASGLCTLPGAP